MRTDRLAWSQVACDNLKKAGATDEIFYYRRVLGKEKYAAHVFIAQYASQEQLKQHWESLNDNIALLYQSNVDSLLERSNFYLCFFLPESLDIIEKEKIENDAYCAKKYIFVSKKELSIEEKIRKINEKIFELTYLEPQDTSETKLISMQVQNFRIYKGQKNFAFTAENSPDCPASLVMIYAPNGMGKTSICDALEWALTGRIQRLSDMEKLIGRSNMLLHNREKYKSVEEYRRNKEYALVKLVLRNRAGAQDELQRVVRMNQITEISHSSIEALNTARTRAQKALQNQQKIFSEIAALVEKPEPRIEDLKQAREICVFEQEQKQTQISKLGNVIYSEGVSESIRKYNEYKTKIESLEHKIVTRKQALQKAQEALEAEKKTLLAELQKYFQQPLFNEIYQKIDPHPYMKKVSYEIMYNDEKNEPELYIKTLADKREPYHPELFFSTAQLNTVALSSFLSRALSLTEIPIGTIVIDDPVGHFDDMNILGFADLMRSIIEKSQKQIVITTHDETVYQIFRRKLPPEIYSSRFIDMTAE